jgi:hypothetical protein
LTRRSSSIERSDENRRASRHHLREEKKAFRPRYRDGPFLGNLPPEILDVVVEKLGWFQTTFAMAGRTCREAVERVPSTRAVLTEEERKQFRWPEMTPLAVAALEGDVEALEWLIQLFDGKRLKWRDLGTGLSRLAAGRVRLESLTCLRANGCPWDEWDVLSRGFGRPPGGTAVGASERVPVGLWDVLGLGLGRAPGGTAVGASERVPVERGHVLVRGQGRAPGSSAVGA